MNLHPPFIPPIYAFHPPFIPGDLKLLYPFHPPFIPLAANPPLYPWRGAALLKGRARMADAGPISAHAGRSVKHLTRLWPPK